MKNECFGWSGIVKITPGKNKWSTNENARKMKRNRNWRNKEKIEWFIFILILFIFLCAIFGNKGIFTTASVSRLKVRSIKWNWNLNLEEVFVSFIRCCKISCSFLDVSNPHLCYILKARHTLYFEYLDWCERV